jgi:diguanylate cyclase (GGDEF)-like protein
VLSTTCCRWNGGAPCGRAARASRSHDFDLFKKVNDEYGHPAGDDCLRLVASAIGATAQRPGDLAARFGGEEFALLLPNTDARGAKIIAERVRAAVIALAIPHAGNSARQVVTIGVGISTIRSSGLGKEKPDAGYSRHGRR